MSHFTVAVFTKREPNEDRIAEALAPYYEQVEEGDEYCKFNDKTQQIEKEWNEPVNTFYKRNDSYYFNFEKVKGEEDEYEEVTIPFKDCGKYETLDDFVEDCHGYSHKDEDDETSPYGYWHNPEAKWDWWVIGGRWRDMLRTKEGDCDSCQLKDLILAPTEEKAFKVKRFWEINIEQAECTQEEKEKYFTLYKPEYYLEIYKTKEEYIRLTNQFSTFAVVDENGEWFEKGTMGWFGCSSDTAEEANNWYNNYEETFIKSKDSELWITIVDCHI